MMRLTRVRLSAGLLLTLLAASFSLPLASSRAARPHAQPKAETRPTVPATQQSEQPPDVILAAPYWSTADGFVSTIEMKNYHVTNPLTVTPVLHLEHGWQTVAVNGHLRRAEIDGSAGRQAFPDRCGGL